MAKRADVPASALPLAIHSRCVALGRKLDVCCLRTLHKRSGADEDDWKACVNESIVKRIESSYITAVHIEEAPKSLHKYNFVCVLGYANGLITLSGVEASGEFHVISHNDQNTAKVNHVEVHIDKKADESEEACLHSFALLEGGTIVRFPWATLQQTNVVCGEGIVGICASLQHSVIAQYAEDRMVLRSLDTASTLKTFQDVNSQNWREMPCAWNPQKKLLAFAGVNAVRYTSAPKWEVYKFGEAVAHVDAVRCLQFTMFGEMVALLTASRDKVAIWDFDTETLLYSQEASSFRLCGLTELSDKEVSLVVFEDNTTSVKWRSTRLTLPVDDVMEVVGGKRSLAEGSLPSKGKGIGSNKKLKNMIDMEAEDAGDNDDDDVANLFGEMGTADLEEERDEALQSETDYRSRNVDLLGMLDEETSITLIEDMDRLKRRVAQLEKRSSSRNALTPGSCPPPRDESSQWLLYWDDAGQITKQGSGDTITLHVHVFSGPYAGYSQKHDRHNCHTAALSQSALVTASEVEYEGNQHSIISFHNLGTNETWERRLKDETVAAVAVAEDFVAALGNTSLYIYSIAGSLLGVYYMKGAPTGIAARGNLLAVISEVSSYPKCSSVFSTRLIWVNGLRGLARNSINRVVDLYDDILVIPPGRHITWISISDQLNLWISDSAGQLISLVPAMASLNKMGGMSLEWVPSLQLAEISSDDKAEDKQIHIRVFPLYINEQKLCYIRLREGETQPHNTAPLNFLGYTLRKVPLRIESASGAYMPFKAFNSILTRDPTLKEISKTGLVEDVASIPWQQYDEMRHSLTLQRAQIEMLMHLQQAYGFWFKDAERITQKASTSMGNVERVHDKWLLRMLRKVKGQRKDANVAFDIMRMLMYQKCLETAADILSEQMDNRQRKVLQEASILLANAPVHGFMPPQQSAPEYTASAETRAVSHSADEVKVMKRVCNPNVGKGQTVPEPKETATVEINPTEKTGTKVVQGFNTMEDEERQPDHWIDHVFKT